MDKNARVGLVIALAVIALLGFGTYLFIAAIIDKLNAINSDLGKAIVAGAVTILAALATLLVGKIWEQRLKIQQDVREKKIPVYEEQMETLFNVVFSEKIGAGKPTEQDMQKAFLAFTEKLIV